MNRNPTTNLDRTPYLLIVGDLLAEAECGLLCHGQDLDRLRVQEYPRHSASGEMVTPVLARLTAVVLERYKHGPLNPTAAAVRDALQRSLDALEGVLPEKLAEQDRQWLPATLKE